MKKHLAYLTLFLIFVLLIGAILPQSITGPKKINVLIGTWHGRYEQYEISSGGKITPLKSKKVPRISIRFKSDYSGYINYEDSIETLPPSNSNFNYRFIKNDVVALTNKGYKSYYRFKTNWLNKLNLHSYPEPREPQEDVAIITLIDFYKIK